MNKFFFFFALLSTFCVILMGCSSKQSQENSKDELSFNKTLAAADTNKVLAMANTCIEKLKAGNIAEAFSTVYIIDERNNELIDMPDSIRDRLVQKYNKFKVYDYRLDSFYFERSDSNEVKYSYQFVKDNPDMTMTMVFLPVKIGSDWYLTIKGTGCR